MFTTGWAAPRNFDGRILDANDAFLRMVQYDREDLVAGRMRWTEMTPPLAEREAKIRRLIDFEHHRNFFLEFRRSNS